MAILGPADPARVRRALERFVHWPARMKRRPLANDRATHEAPGDRRRSGGFDERGRARVLRPQGGERVSLSGLAPGPSMRKLCVALALACASGVAREREARAQAAPVAGASTPPSRAWVDFGWGPTWVVGGGYSHALTGLPLPLSVDASLRLPPFATDGLDAWQLGAGATAFVGGPGLGATVGAHPFARLASDSTGLKLGAGATLSARPGYYGRSWSITADLSWSSVVLSYMRHSDAVRDLFRDRYPEGPPGGEGAGPRDGLFTWPAHRVRLGVASGVGLGGPLALHAALGLAHAAQKGPLLNAPVTPMPFYLEAGLQWRW